MSGITLAKVPALKIIEEAAKKDGKDKTKAKDELNVLLNAINTALKVAQTAAEMMNTGSLVSKVAETLLRIVKIYEVFALGWSFLENDSENCARK